MREETRIVFRVSDDFVCQECDDEVLESWSGSRIPVFRLTTRVLLDASLGTHIAATAPFRAYSPDYNRAAVDASCRVIS
jgi:hypothetical protein